MKKEIPLFDWDNKKLVSFAYNSRNQNVVETVNSEMIRRMIISIDDFNRQSYKQTKEMIYLTKWIIILTIFLGIIGIIQIVKLFC